MQAVTTITVMALCLGLSAAVAPPLKISNDFGLMKFMMQSREANNPQRSMECFYYYMPILEDISVEYKKSYLACQSKADLDRSGIDEASLPKRQDIEQSAQNACDALSACNDHANSIDYFGCYVTAGNDNTKQMYVISANAAEILSEIQEDLRLIDNVEYKCTNASERQYIKDSTEVNQEMQNCLLGLSPVPTDSSPTEEPEFVAIVEKAAPVPAVVFQTEVEQDDVVHRHHRSSNVHFADKVRKHLRQH